MDYKLVMNMAVMAGELMLRSGAETYRVEDTMYHILRTAGTQTVEASVMMTGIVATISNPDMEPITMIKRVQERGTNLNRIMQVNEISRNFCTGKLSLEAAFEEMKAISGKQYRVWVYNLATVVVPAGFSPLYGGGGAEILASAAVGAILALVITGGKKLQINGFILDALSSLVVAAAAMLLKGLFPFLNNDTVIISAIMPLVPGVAITNAVRDTLQGDYISGSARILEAFFKAVAIALGAGAGMAFINYFFTGGGLL
ncbi:threonine/serine exporter family protein [Clostridium sp. C105KSO13]|uniref:threonine/serine exporter family protein n=1 Tax=Clostridium sp. C105KSO13 TaxID=1776045 RepID=UPI000740731E|nr:threonine/serine exporter family protein [Clostridium sp. C105KSO13]CUX27766.1 Inner membrane protein YjjP [Clostridium sp. C105KSO13]